MPLGAEEARSGGAGEGVGGGGLLDVVPCWKTSPPQMKVFRNRGRGHVSKQFQNTLPKNQFLTTQE